MAPRYYPPVDKRCVDLEKSAVLPWTCATFTSAASIWGSLYFRFQHDNYLIIFRIIKVSILITSAVRQPKPKDGGTSMRWRNDGLDCSTICWCFLKQDNLRPPVLLGEIPLPVMGRTTACGSLYTISVVCSLFVSLETDADWVSGKINTNIQSWVLNKIN